MKIFTYYEKINFKQQDELVFLWQKSWAAHGFEPIVLTDEDARKSDFYEEFLANISRVHQEIAGKPLTPYGLSCWLRWLAYSTQDEDKFYVSDYDLINHHFEPTAPSEVLHFMDDCCPCFASGGPSQFLTLCKEFVEVSDQNKAFFVEAYRQRGFVHFHDQNYFVIRYDIQKTDKNRGIKLTRDRNFISGPQRGDGFWEKPLVHYSHNGCREYCNKTHIDFNDVQRCNIIKGHLK